MPRNSSRKPSEPTGPIDPTGPTSKARPGERTAKAGRAGPALPSELVREQVDKVTDKLDTKLAKLDRKMAEKSAKVAEKAAKLDVLAQQFTGLDVWTRETTGRRPRFTREEIALAALGIADEEGLAALSMRYLAQRLDVGTMTLYHYVRTKDELLALVHDTIMGEVVVPDDVPWPEHWRDALTLVAQRSRAALTRHPWTLDITEAMFGPNTVRHFDQTLRTVRPLGLPLADQLEIVQAVDDYTFGYCVQERDFAPALRQGSADNQLVAYVNGLLGSGSYPTLSALADELGLDEMWAQMRTHLRPEGRFERNLDRLLDGIEASLPPAVRRRPR